MTIAKYMVVGGLLIVVAGCSNNDKQIGGSGLIESDEVIVSAQTSGQSLKLFFDEGWIVKEGDTLTVIDPSKIELQRDAAVAGRQALADNLSSAKLQVEQATTREQYATTELNRVTQLLNSGTATQKQYDAVKFEYDQASIALKTAKSNAKALWAQLDKADADIALINRQLKDAYPVAPVPGTITEKYIQAGDLLAPGKPIARISKLDTVWVKVYLPAGDFANVKLGESASVSTESGGKEFPGTVTWTASEAEFTPKNVQTMQSRADLVYAVKVSIPNTDSTLKVGMPVFVTLGKL